MLFALFCCGYVLGLIKQYREAAPVFQCPSHLGPGVVHLAPHVPVVSLHLRGSPLGPEKAPSISDASRHRSKRLPPTFSGAHPMGHAPVEPEQLPRHTEKGPTRACLIGPLGQRCKWSGRWDSNPRPSAWQADALAPELRPRHIVACVTRRSRARSAKTQSFWILRRLPGPGRPRSRPPA